MPFQLIRIHIQSKYLFVFLLLNHYLLIRRPNIVHKLFHIGQFQFIDEFLIRLQILFLKFHSLSLRALLIKK